MEGTVTISVEDYNRLYERDSFVDNSSRAIKNNYDFICWDFGYALHVKKDSDVHKILIDEIKYLKELINKMSEKKETEKRKFKFW